MYQRIFVPVDNSAQSNQALDEAVKIAKAMNSTLILALCVDLPHYGAGNPEHMDSFVMEHPLMDEGKEMLQASCDRAREAGIEPESELLANHGHKTSKILLECAKANEADVIVMGTHGHTFLGQALMGSVAEGILQAAEIPVIMIRSQA